MAVTFAIRGDSKVARYSNGGATPRSLGSTSAAVGTADAAAIGGFSISLAAAQSGLQYPGHRNHEIDAPGISILSRAKFANITSSAMFNIGNETRFGHGSLECIFRPDSNYCRHYASTAGGLFGLNNADITIAFSDTTTFHDLVWTWDFTTTASSWKFYIDGTLIGSLSPTQAFALTEDLNTNGTKIAIGAGKNWHQAQYDLNEFVIWNEVIDPTSVGLVSGTGSLNGSSRTSYVDVDAYDGEALAYATTTDPGIANVLSGTGYAIQGASLTGTYVCPVSTDPGVGNVTTGTNYSISGTALSGTYVPADFNQVVVGEQYGADGTEFTGIYAATVSTDPGVANVRTGTDYTIEGAPLSGAYVPATASKYQEGEQYGNAGTEFTGTLNFNTFSPTNYTTVAQVKSMFRRIKIEDDTGDEDTNTVLTTEEVVQFMDDIDAEINAKLSAWYALPITGQKSLNLLNTISKWKVAHIVKTVLEVTNQNSDKQQDVQSNLEKKANKLLDEILPSYKNGRWLDPVSELPDAPRNAVSPKTGELFGKNYSGVRTPQIKKGGDNW